MNHNHKARHLILACVLLVAVTVAAYWPIHQCNFVNVDDPGYVQANDHEQHGLTWKGVQWAFTTGYLGNWHPLTWLSHMLIIQWFGVNPMAHHLTNLVLHVVNTLLLLAFLFRTTGALGRSVAVSCLFALHPLHVQSVAWVSERKDVLSAFFFFLTLLAYALYAQKLSSVEHRAAFTSRPWSLDYALVLLFFVLGLMSKPMLVTLPFVLLLLDYWPLKRITLPIDQAQHPVLKRLVIEKVPLFALSALFCVVTFVIQNRTGAVSPVSLFPLDLRVMNAVASYARYLQKTVWPAKLAFFYPYPSSIPAETIVLAMMVLAGISFLAIKLWRQRPYLATGWLLYLGMLVPVIGLVKIGSEAMADRYTYLPSVGLFTALVWVIADLTREHASWRIPVMGGSLLLIPVFVVLTHRQVLFWQNSETLARHALDVTIDNAPARICLGGALLEQGKFAEATAHFQEAARLLPNYSMAWRHLGQAYLRQGNAEAALGPLETAQRLNPNDPVTGLFLAQAYQKEGKTRLAIDFCRRCLSLDKEQPIALNNLAWILATDPDAALRNGAEAVQLAEQACKITHYQKAMFLGTLAAAYAEVGKFELAVATAEKARARALENGNREVAAKNEQLLTLYRMGQAYHENPAVTNASPVVQHRTTDSSSRADSDEH